VKCIIRLFWAQLSSLHTQSLRKERHQLLRGLFEDGSPYRLNQFADYFVSHIFIDRLKSDGPG